MRIAIFGTGGAGGYFGAQLAQAGEDVLFIARGDHLRAIKATGLRLETPAGETVIRAQATDDLGRNRQRGRYSYWREGLAGH